MINEAKLILDNISNTCQLDENTEKKIVEILIELSKKITVIFVTHNPSNLKHCTNVIKLDNDQITNSLQNENEYEVLKKQ